MTWNDAPAAFRAPARRVSLRRRIAAVAIVALVAAPGALRAQATTISLTDIVGLLRGKMNTTQVLGAIGERCLDFRVNPSIETQLRQEGADAALIDGLRETCSRPPTRQTAAVATVEIVGRMPPGWSRTVNGAFRSENRMIELTRPGTIVASAPGWCPARIDVDLPPGENQLWTPTMRARPWVGDCPAVSDH